MKLVKIALCCALAGCSSYTTAPPLTPVVTRDSPIPPDVARVCVVRTSALAMAVAFPTKDNGVLVGATKGPTYFCYYAAPGPHRITMIADNETAAVLTAEAGRAYILHQQVDFLFGVVRVRPVWVTPDRAGELFEHSDYEVLTSVPGTEKLPDDGVVAAAMPSEMSR